MRLSPLMTCDLRGRDAPRLKRLRRALREVKKPSRWYHDDPADTGSLYRKRTIAGLDVCLDIIVNSPDGALVDSAKGLLCNARGLLPLTFAQWIEDRNVELVIESGPAPDTGRAPARAER
ncbi:MAG: hypothetical protein M3Z96_05145 [Pseudomonadota bacterium]|nr:hypothetical protein [Pseudomonadota bacterium]